MTGLAILGTGRCLPRRCVTNDEMALRVETSDEWIATRTGIRQRYFASPDEPLAVQAAQAARLAMEQAGVGPGQIGLCVAASFTADHATPALACEVHGLLGLPETAFAFDVNAACTGFLAALETARCMLAAGNPAAPGALVIGAEQVSRVLDMDDRSTCVLFGDGAGAAVVRLDEAHPYWCRLGSRGDAAILHAGGPGSADPWLHMDGKAVFRFASDTVPACLTALLADAGCTMEQVDWVVCHQANGRIIDHVVKKLGAPPEKFYKNMQRYANTSAASIPLALDEMAREGLLRAGQKVACVGFGAGLTWGGALLTW